MTRTPTRRLLVLALATAITAPAAWAQETVDPQAAFGIAPPQPAANAHAPAVRPDSSFTVSDIRVDGLQRIGAGTVFTYLPIERGDRVNKSDIGQAIRALYTNRFLEAVYLGRQGEIRVVDVVERESIHKMTTASTKTN